ncbi:MAG: DUF4835 family protein [Bacteroidales bacterium]|nr:DUF4835 family protein [Bacteroidales bacterium]
MTRLSHILLAALMAVLALSASAQELQCGISVTSASVQGTNKQVYDEMRTAIQDFMSQQIWTQDKFESRERIECSFNFNITSQVSSNEFKGTLTVQLRRPVFNSSYTTTMLNVQDKDIQFRYNQGQPLTYNPNSYDPDNLVPLLAFYVNFMLGLDYDSFSPNGGSQYFKQAETIVNQAQSSQFGGWKSFDGTTNRYWLINNAMDDNHRNFHSCLYDYHRRGLDQMADNFETARDAVRECLDKIKDIRRRISRNPYLLNLFFTAKSDEIVNIFSEAPQIEKDKIIEIMQVADPANISKYQKLRK